MDFRQCEYNVPLKIGFHFELFFDDFPRDITWRAGVIYSLSGLLNKIRLLWLAQSVKNLPPTQEIWVGSLGREFPLEKEMATHYSILVWKIPWAEELGGLQSLWLPRVRREWVTNTFTFTADNSADNFRWKARDSAMHTQVSILPQTFLIAYH